VAMGERYNLKVQAAYPTFEFAGAGAKPYRRVLSKNFAGAYKNRTLQTKKAGAYKCLEGFMSE
jgi:hypothetical protein